MTEARTRTRREAIARQYFEDLAAILSQVGAIALPWAG